MTPADLTQKINAGIDFLSLSIEQKWLKKTSLKISSLISALFVAVAYGLFFQTFTLNPVFHSLTNPSFFESRYFWIIPIITPLILILESLLSFFIDSPAIKGLIIFPFGIILIPTLIANHSPEVYPRLTILAEILTLLSHAFLLYATRKLKINIRLLLFMALEFALILFFKFALAEDVFSNTFWMGQPYRYIFIFTILAAEEHIRRAGTSYNFRTLSFICNPTNFITPLPISFSEWTPNESKKAALKARSLVFLAISLFVLFCCIAVFKTGIRHLELHNRGSFYWLRAGVLEYLNFFTFSYVNITVPIAICWWFGYDLPDAYNLPLLATSPQDRWRRWNTYFYKWYFDFVFFPTYKIYKSLFISVMAAFGVTLFIHLGQNNSSILDLFMGTGIPRGFYLKAAFFCIHGLLVYLGIKFDRFLPRENQRKAWISVFIMFIVMSFLHGIFLL